MEKFKILIVDDEPEITFFLSRHLKKNNFFTYTAGNLADAEGLIYSEMPQIVLLDNHLPDGFGIDFLQKMKDKDNSPIFVIITAHDTPQDRQKAKENGASAFISKPFEMAMVTKTIESLIK